MDENKAEDITGSALEAKGVRVLFIDRNALLIIKLFKTRR
jgi:hypothetical protein